MQEKNRAHVMGDAAKQSLEEIKQFKVRPA